MKSAQTKTLQLRLKDKQSAFLHEQAGVVNFAWNYCNELSVKHFKRQRQFLSAYDMQPYTKGVAKELGLHSQSLQAIQEEYVTRRKRQHCQALGPAQRARKKKRVRAIHAKIKIISRTRTTR